MQKDTYYIWALLVVVLIGITALFFFGHSKESSEAQNEIATSTDEVAGSNDQLILPWGTVDLTVGEKAKFDGLSIKPLSIEEESRCPSNVQCIQAGTVRVKVETVSLMGTSTDILTLGEFLTTEAESIMFREATPYPVAGAHIPTSAYVLTFDVVKSQEVIKEEPTLPLPKPPVTSNKTCYVGGCSSQLCSDTPDMVSTCEYREEYACYQNAVCEQQATGECGWTVDAELRSCLAKES